MNKYFRYLKLFGREINCQRKVRNIGTAKLKLLCGSAEFKRSYSLKMDQQIHIMKSENDKRNYRYCKTLSLDNYYIIQKLAIFIQRTCTVAWCLSYDITYATTSKNVFIFLFLFSRHMIK